MNISSKDPVCGMAVLSNKGLVAVYKDQTIHFCSEYCKQKFLDQPERYRASLVAPAYDEAKENRRVAYFSMEVAAGSSMPTYSGGLGVLAGDTLKSCADLRVPVVGVSLLYRKGYFDQKLDEWGNQSEGPVQWQPERFLHPLPETVQIDIEQRKVSVRAWQHDFIGISGYVVPLILLDTNVEGNTDYDRALSDYLYGGDDRYRLAQEILLGIGGARALRPLGYTGVQKFHMNEGHASLLVLELLNRQYRSQLPEWDFESVRNRCIFTTHTPVPAGHDQFDYDLVRRVLGEAVPFDVLRMLCGQDRLNMTLLALNLSRYVNGVAKRHEEVSRDMFPGHLIHHVTNGIHSWTWTSDSFKLLYDRYLPGWGKDPSLLRQAVRIPKNDIWDAHVKAKSELLAFIKQRTNTLLSPDALTIGFARRATEYKRTDLIFSDLDRLLRIAGQAGPLQFVFAGKAHPRDHAGKELIQRIFAISRQTGDHLPIVYLENYDLEMARLIVSGVDLWLNTPQRPLEASGTSGMKAAHNGVPSFSSLDGWWIEGHIEGVTGWSIGSREAGMPGTDFARHQDAEDLYQKLESVIVPLFYRNREQWIDVMQHSIAMNASFFNTHRMVQQYVTNAYLP
ncbi:MAG: alpha-glucan family phosphorylase [Blastocatellia bacterium]|nr:alpha-glucan family phosphorylase [Blastocatellia bacterium]